MLAKGGAAREISKVGGGRCFKAVTLRNERRGSTSSHSDALCAVPKGGTEVILVCCFPYLTRTLQRGTKNANDFPRTARHASGVNKAMR